MEVLGIDIGGSGMKGGIVDIKTGEMITERFRIPTPESGSPKKMGKVVTQIVDHFKWNGPIGCGFPTSMKNGVCLSASNLSDKWVGINVENYFSELVGQPITVINDADAAGLAEMHFGAGKNRTGFVLVITLGTGIGSGAFYNGQLIQNTEIGQMYYKKYENVEHYAANSVRKSKDMSFEKWGKRLNNFFEYAELIFSPDLFIIGGGGSKYWQEIKEQIDIRTEIVPAEGRNQAGIIGAAMAGRRHKFM
ncbi:polyphosphate--glucose phosphotransferase [Robertkochia aurantiaca]|uniref:polyphosphate--glucose phosphotransferase n=1 Tax=Robertkochia aurantiaca TaxID=2873700 RepID=UPI001CCB7787|nr:ROK family protein [Robertkochia sp. 3YJGBD-33]